MLFRIKTFFYPIILLFLRCKFVSEKKAGPLSISSKVTNRRRMYVQSPLDFSADYTYTHYRVEITTSVSQPCFRLTARRGTILVQTANTINSHAFFSVDFHLGDNSLKETKEQKRKMKKKKRQKKKQNKTEYLLLWRVRLSSSCK